MTQEQLNKIINDADARMLALEVQKGAEYVCGDEDRLANFKRIGYRLGLAPLQIWAVYFQKHYDSLINFIRTGKEESTENIEGRIDDMCVYLKLLRGLVYEHKQVDRLNEELDENPIETSCKVVGK